MFNSLKFFKPKLVNQDPTDCTQAAHDFIGAAGGTKITKADLMDLGGWSDIHSYDIDAASANAGSLTLTFPGTTAQTVIHPSGSRSFCGKVRDDGYTLLPATDFCLEIPEGETAVVTFVPII